MAEIEDRQEIFNKYLEESRTIRCVKRMLLAYNRYFECEEIKNNLNEDFKNLKVLDYGCGVGDYGIFFARLGSKVTFYDFREMLEAVKVRIDNEKLDCTELIEVGTPLPTDFDLVIFGEVLEHLTDPLHTLSQFKAKYIFTSSYPYKNKSEFEGKAGVGDHTQEAWEQQPFCKWHLEENYTQTKLSGERRLWKLK